jgi:DNA-binding winged helix-turn-helix (wHTH) protein
VIYKFGPFRLDLRAEELRRNSDRVPLAPKVFQLAVLMVENPGRLVTKRELLDKVWPETNVEEGSVTRAMTRLRSALSDDAARPQYIETVARRGYRFVAAVHNVMAGDTVDESPFQIAVQERRYPLSDGENLIGRADDCQISLKLASISRHHAVITVERRRMTLRDLDSKNGTFVEGRRIEGIVNVSEGQPIRLGTVTLSIVRVSGGSTRTETARRTGGRSE